MTGTIQGNGAVEAGAPGIILELAEGCRTFVARAVGVELDFSPDTLPLLDHYLGMARGGIDQRPEVLELIVRSAGAYFGEVVRRQFDGFWRRSEADAYRWQLCLRRVSVAFNPAGVIHEVLARGSDLPGPEAALQLDPADRRSVEQRLDALPPVPEEDFYLTTTRFEALEVTYETLREKMRTEGLEDVEFDADDYEDPV